MLLLSCHVETENGLYDNNEKPENTGDGGNTDMEEKVVFDRENTVNLIKAAIDRSDREVEWMVDDLESVGINGAVRAQLLDSLELDKSLPTNSARLEIESEDGRIYHMYLTFHHTSGFDNDRMYVVGRIFDVEKGLDIFNIEWEECGMSEAADAITDLFEEVDFDYGNTVQIIQEALSIEERDAQTPLTRMASLGIKGVVNAREVEDSSVTEGDRVLDIETEDNRHYRLILNRFYVIRTVINLETNETIFPRPR